MPNERMWTLIGRTLAGEASQDEVKELEELRNENPHINYYIEILAAWWNLAEREGKDEAEQACERLLKKLENDEHNNQATINTFIANRKNLFKKIRSRQTLQPSDEKQHTSNHFLKLNVMIKNYFEIAWRTIKKHKSYTLISVTGLAFGICACIAVFLITDHEFAFDKFHPDHNSIYPIVANTQNSTGEEFGDGVIAHYRH